MNIFNKIQNKQGQSLPLNTIVIAILVIIVLLVIIVFFTGQVGNTGDQLEQNSPSSCSSSNPALSTLGYKHFISEEQYNSGLINKADFSKAIGVSDCYVSSKELTGIPSYVASQQKNNNQNKK